MPTALESTPLTCKRSEEGIVSIHLSSPDRPVVILDAALLQQLDATLDALLECSVANDITGVLLCSDCSRVFIAGADLREIDALNDEDLRAYLAFGSSVFSKLALLPCPTAACIDGAALGGGLEIALHCDGLIASATNAKGKPYPIGLPECGLGLLARLGRHTDAPSTNRPANSPTVHRHRLDKHEQRNAHWFDRCSCRNARRHHVSSHILDPPATAKSSQEWASAVPG